MRLKGVTVLQEDIRHPCAHLHHHNTQERLTEMEGGLLEPTNHSWRCHLFIRNRQVLGAENQEGHS